jgi:hypothetical protein
MHACALGVDIYGLRNPSIEQIRGQVAGPDLYIFHCSSAQPYLYLRHAGMLQQQIHKSSSLRHCHLWLCATHVFSRWESTSSVAVARLHIVLPMGLVSAAVDLLCMADRIAWHKYKDTDQSIEYSRMGENCMRFTPYFVASILLIRCINTVYRLDLI